MGGVAALRESEFKVLCGPGGSRAATARPQHILVFIVGGLRPALPRVSVCERLLFVLASVSCVPAAGVRDTGYLWPLHIRMACNAILGRR
jgi:hypothetical protein